MLGLSSLRSPFVYERVSSQPVDGEEVAGLMEKTEQEGPPAYYYSNRKQQSKWAWPWMVSTAILAVVCVFLATCLRVNIVTQHCNVESSSTALGSFERGFVTDLQPMTEAIDLHKRKFWGGKKAYDNGTWYSNWNPDEPRYVGMPSAEIDAAWRKLIGPFVSLTPAEAMSIEGAREFHGEYPATTTVQHSLHCLNFMRQSVYGGEFYPDVVNPPPGTASFWPHMEHCVETLRQVVECGADITALPMRWDDGAGMLLVDFEREHTCRNYQGLLRWAENRYGEDVLRMGGFGN